MIREDTAIPVIEADDLHLSFGGGFPLAEQPFLAEIAATGEPRSGVLTGAPLGPRVRDFVEGSGITSGAGVPIKINGSLHGILGVVARGPRITSAELRRLVRLGKLIEDVLGSRSAGTPG